MWIIYFALFLGAVYLQPTEARSQPEFYDLNQSPQYFVKFIADYNKHYKDNKDLLDHYEAFKESLRRINVQNSQSNALWQAGINAFSDYTEEELKNLYGVKTTEIPHYLSGYSG